MQSGGSRWCSGAWRRPGRPLALVVSALGDTTEWLLEAGRAAAAGDGTGAAAAVGRALALARTRAVEVLGPGGSEELEAPWAPILDDAARALSALSSARALEPRRWICCCR